MERAPVKLADALLDVQRIFIETAPLIYFIEKNAGYFEVVRALMERVHQGQIAGVTSVVTLTEVLTLPLRTGQQALQQAYRAILLNSQYFTLAPIDSATAIRAAELRAKYTLKTPDALQIAAALQTGCHALLTNDSDMKRLQEIRILVLGELEL